MSTRAKIQAVSSNIQTLKSQNAIEEAMIGVTKAILIMNKRVSKEGPPFLLSDLDDHLLIDFSIKVTSNSKHIARFQKSVSNDGYGNRNCIKARKYSFIV